MKPIRPLLVLMSLVATLTVSGLARADDETMPMGAKFLASCDAALARSLIRVQTQGAVRIVETDDHVGAGEVKVHLAVNSTPRLRMMPITADMACGRLDLDVMLSLRDFVLQVPRDYPPDSCEARRIMAREDDRVTRVLRDLEGLRNVLEANLIAQYERKVFAVRHGEDFDTGPIVRHVAAEAVAQWEKLVTRTLAHPSAWTRPELAAACARK